MLINDALILEAVKDILTYSEGCPFIWIQCLLNLISLIFILKHCFHTTKFIQKLNFQLHLFFYPKFSYAHTKSDIRDSC